VELDALAGPVAKLVHRGDVDQLATAQDADAVGQSLDLWQRV
jgi:hypothetical protein